ncbi:MAG: hypothetical protein JOZ39_11430 [Chloroflexi bacterium]|nr:hypothetical protein [Chloroflexota bacterium]
MVLHLPAGLLPRHTHLLCLLAVEPGLTRADYQRYCGVSFPTAKRDLADLARRGLVMPCGSARARCYSLGPAARLTGSYTPDPSRVDPYSSQSAPDSWTNDPNLRRNDSPPSSLEPDHLRINVVPVSFPLPSRTPQTRL